jgi:putative ABC transport system permease protein
LRELGIRLALGATPSNLMRFVLRGTIGVVATGAIVGAALSSLATRALRPFLFGVPSTDVVSYVLVLFALVIVAIVASWRPARRATRIQPMRVLRVE